VNKTHRNLSCIRLSLTGTSRSPTEDPRPETAVTDMFKVDNWIEMYFGVIEELRTRDPCTLEKIFEKRTKAPVTIGHHSL